MNAHARVTVGKAVAIQSIAAQMLAEANGDMALATTKLVNYAGNIASYRDELLKIGARKLLNEVPQTQRAAILRERASITTEPKGTHRMCAGTLAAQARLQRSGNFIKGALLEMPYTIGGITRRLGDWTGMEILGHGEVEHAKGASAVRNARFLVAVGRAAGERKVGEAVQIADLERMKREAEASEV